MLSDSEPDGDGLQQLTINEHYAKAYSRKKEREELAKLKEKYGSDVEGDRIESEDSEDTDEDEEGEELTPAVDAAILRTLARIKRKDPDIYDSQKDVFKEEQQKTRGSFSFSARKEDKSKPLLLKQHILQSQLQSTSRSPSPEPAEPTHAEEQVALRKETITVFHSAVQEHPANEDDDDDILIPREKIKDEIEREQEEYRAFLSREVGEDIGGLVTAERQDKTSEDEQDKPKEGRADETEENVGKKKRKKRKRDRKTKEQEDHEFLMHYILNRGWVDKTSRHVPKYDEITGTNSKREGTDEENDVEHEAGQTKIVGWNQDGQEEDFDEEEFDEVAETFESSYNFRFEEPNAASIATHPREIASTVRREENPRKEQRERKKQRKEETLLQKREEVKRLKALKMKEIREKLERIGKEGGKNADDKALQQLDLESDWDPEAHDRQMAGIYGNDEVGAGDTDIEKPTWDDDIDIADIVPPEAKAGHSSPKGKKNTRDERDEEADGIDIDEMDADLVDTKGKLEKEKALEEAMEDVYGLEFNDLVGDMPTRFKYTPVLPGSYGLSATEILLADDKDLNGLVGLRKLAPYRKDRGRSWDPRRKERLRDFRTKLGEKRGTIFGGAEGSGATGMVKKRKGKKERQKEKLAVAKMADEPLNIDGPNDRVEDHAESGELPKKKRKRRRMNSTQAKKNI